MGALGVLRARPIHRGIEQMFLLPDTVHHDGNVARDFSRLATASVGDVAIAVRLPERPELGQ